MMKKFFFVVSLLLIFMPISVFAGWQDPIHSGDFVTTWKTDDGKVSLGFNLEGTTMYDVSWNCDGNYEQGIWDLKITHDYTVSGTYDICLKSSGKLQFNPSRLTTDEKVKLQEIKQWGNIKWSSFNSAFNGMINVQLTAIDAPDLSAVTDMSSAFHGANKLTGCDSMNTWNTINVTNMTSMFENAGKFNAPIGNWNTSNVKDMSRMFRNAQSFNQPIGNWNTSNVESMSQMFHTAKKFNQNISGWNTSGVTNMSYMFYNATTFNQPIGNWNTSNVKDMRYIFCIASAFNQPIGNWNMNGVTNMTYMFYNASSFNQDIGSWNTSGVTNMSYMFDGATSFNNGDILGGSHNHLDWDTSSVKNMYRMFRNAQNFNSPITGWDTSSVENMSQMFNGATLFNQDISDWDVSKVTDFSNFLNNSNLNINNYDKLLSGWSQQLVQSNVPFGAINIYYCDAQIARDNLTTNYNWTIDDGGLACPPTNITLSNTGVDEGTTYVGQFTGTDTNLPLTYSLVAGEGSEDNNKFTLSLDGVLAFAIAPDFETPLGNGGNGGNNYIIRVQAKNSRSLTTEAVFIITVIDVDDFPPVIEIIPSKKINNGPIMGTIIKVSDRFSIESISLAGSTTATSNLSCVPILPTPANPFINPTPVTGQHGVITCDVDIKSSGRLVVTAKDMSGNVATAFEDGYRIDSQGPQLTVFKVDTQTYGIHKPVVHFDVLDPSALEKYELIYVENNNVTGTVSSPSTGTYTTGSAYISGGVILNLDPDEKPHEITIRAYGKCGNITTRPIVFGPIVVFETPTMISSGTITDIVKIYASATGGEIENILVGGTAGATLVSGSCVSPFGGTGDTYITSVTCNINIFQTGVVTVEAKDSTTNLVGQNSQKYFVETSAPTITIIPSKKSSNQAITGVVEIQDDVVIDADQITGATNPSGQISTWNCVQTNGKRVDCSWTLSGSASLTISAVDSAGNLSTQTETGFVIDTIPPVVAFTSTDVISSLNQGSYPLTGSCTAGDGDVYVTINNQPFVTSCSGGNWNFNVDFSSFITYPDGNIPLKISQTDALGNSTTITGLLLKDTQAPIFTVTPADGAYLNQQLNTILGTSESGAVITISMLSGTQILTGEVDVNGDWSINITPAFDEGTYEIIVSAEDEHGNKSIDYDINFTIDMTKPVLTLSGSATVNLFVGDVFADEGAIRTDAVDGTGIVYSLNVVDSSQEGTYELEYDYTDQAGNSALTIKRTVIVQAPPVNTGGYYGGGGRYIHNLNEQGDSSSEIIDDEDIVSDPELINAYQWAYEHGITTLSPISRARLYDPITRSELAKMMSVYFMKYGNREQLKGKEGCDGYTDIDMINAELRGYIKTACELEIMGLQSDGKTPLQEFRPNDYVSRAEFSTVFSRMLEGNKYDNNKDDARWEDHLNYLHDRLIITKPDPTITELRAWILLMLYRS